MAATCEGADAGGGDSQTRGWIGTTSKLTVTKPKEMHVLLLRNNQVNGGEKRNLL